MEFFKRFFKGNMTELDNGEYAVCCPFPHTDENGNAYKETRASAHINPEKDVYHCKSCGASHSEVSFLAHMQGITYGEALDIMGELEAAGETAAWETAVENLKNSPEWMDKLKQLGIGSMIDELQLGFTGEGIAFPVFVYDEILDVRTYNPGHDPKVKSLPGKRPLILPYDLWIDDDRPTLLCAGEKDMAIARVHGFNAITFTGGEMSFPKLFKAAFRGRHVYIAYDNDATGRDGARKAATLIREAGGFPHIVQAHYQVCAEKGEDIHDFFQKYKKSAKDLQDILDRTPEFSDADYQEFRNELYPLVSLEDATFPMYSNRVISSRVAVIAAVEGAFEIPAVAVLTKTEGDDKMTIPKGETRTWSLSERNLKDILHLCDNGVKEADIRKKLLTFCGIPPNEKNIRMQIKAKARVFKAFVTDDMESETVDFEDRYAPFEMVVYSIGTRMTNGGKYRMFYKRYAHPLQAQQVVAVTDRVEESDNSVNSFKVTPEVLESLKVFQGDPKTKMAEIAERAKALCGVETLPQIAWMVDLFYHTPLEFYFGKRKERAYLDLMIVGESRTGKSQTAKRLLETYELGVFTSLKTATKAGLIGGSDKTSGGLKTKLGVLPRNHKGAVIMEEFSGGGKEIAKELTEVRSSNVVRITRVNGTTVVPAMVRMLSISNQATGGNGQSIPLRQYPNGIKVLLELIGASEDVARYDGFLLVDEPTSYTNPNEELKIEAFPRESYLNRVRWAWSRKPEQVLIEKDVQDYIVETSNKLNAAYNNHIKIFGAEAWKKLSRMSIAVAACVASHDATGECIVVKQEHVQWARNFMVACYDNPLFKLKQYVQDGRKYTECTPQAVAAMQGLYNQHAPLINQMEMSTEMSLQQLRAVAGLSNDDFNSLVKRLVDCRFIHYGDRIVPSERFRKALAQIDRNANLKQVGEE